MQQIHSTGRPGKLPGFDFLRMITATLLKLNSLDALIPAKEYRGILRSSEWLLREREINFIEGGNQQKLAKKQDKRNRQDPLFITTWKVKDTYFPPPPFLL